MLWSFKEWVHELLFLLKFEIPRWTDTGAMEVQYLSLHSFCDASRLAYAAVAFLRAVKNGCVMIHLLAAKSRIVPI